jgi:hypothetical protein
MLSIGTVQSKGNVSQSTTFVRFQVLMAEVIKMAAFWDVTSGSLVEVDLMMEAVWISETSLYFNKTTRRYIPEGYYLILHRRLVCLWWGMLTPTGTSC